jgi:hypothetical protein
MNFYNLFPGIGMGRGHINQKPVIQDLAVPGDNISPVKPPGPPLSGLIPGQKKPPGQLPGPGPGEPDDRYSTLAGRGSHRDNCIFIEKHRGNF